MTATLFYNPISHNARIVHWFALESGIDLKLKLMDFSKGDHKSAEYLLVNPCGQIPGYRDDDVTCFESSAIIRYLASKHQSKLYPIDDPAKCGRIDAVYEHLRQLPWDTAGQLFFTTILGPQFFNQKEDPENTKALVGKLNAQLQFANDTFFKTSPDYLVGDSISAADIALGTLIVQASMASPPYQVDKFTKIGPWYKKLSNSKNYATVHAALKK
eukprot:TRINITY_DN7141_c0_g1_i1.p1 TRINITY_DN7141_c0_g1~~TRINITY_DN7141_c0_g1_i1.p1  ORF type:complete len:239 (-),score=38.18 TRINITY_DN7141_c0_g1_i1:21-665(-)